MSREESIMQAMVSKFSFIEGNYTIARARRIFIEITGAEDFRKVLEYVHDDLDFSMLLSITGLDMGENFTAIYHTANDEGIIINLKYTFPKDTEIATVTDLYVGGILYEREIIDLLGIKVGGLPEGLRYPLPDNWPADQYPLRKDWTIETQTEGGAN